MPAQPKQRIPKYRIHKHTGQGYVVLNGHALYLGRADNPESHQRYHQIVAEWLTAGRQSPVPPDIVTVKELIARFWRHAQAYYVRPDGRPSSELAVFRSALRPLAQLYGETKASDFSPLGLKAVRQQMVDKNWARRTVNHCIGCIKLVFRWAVENELISGRTYHALQAVASLRRGRSEAREPEPVRSVPPASIDAVKPFLPQPVWAMIQLQLLTAARAGEIAVMRLCDLDMTGRVWKYRPEQHKTAHHGHERAVFIGPRAQAVLRPFLSRPLAAYLFSPQQAVAEQLRLRHERRQTPNSYGNRPGSNVTQNPSRPPGELYTVAAYRRAIAYACDQAFPPPAPLARRKDETVKVWKTRLNAEQKKELAAWRREHRWHPHQLRHNAATELRKEFGIETARIILGHRSAAITEVYAELDYAKAQEVAARVG